MAMNIAYLVGGMIIGYLIRGEVQKRKTAKILVKTLESAVEILSNISETKEDKIEEPESETVVDIDNVWNPDEPIKL